MQDANLEFGLDIIAEYMSRLKAEESLYEFVKQAWQYVEGPNRPYIDGWHMQALCEHLEAVSSGQILRLLINMPPRCSKSLVMCVFWPAWVFIRQPHKRFYFAAHSADLSMRDSTRCRWLISSKWYQSRWGDRYQIKVGADNKKKFETNCDGYRACTSVDSRTTGHEGDLLALDDPNNAADAESDVIRKGVNDWFSAGWSTRLASPEKTGMVVSQQRTDREDVSGYILEHMTEYVHLMLPMEFEKERKCKTIPLPSSEGKVWEDPRQKEGELLWPGFIGPAQLKSLKNSLVNEYRIAGQFQQRPSPSEGGLLKKAWFKWWKHPSLPPTVQIIQSWDTALAANERDAYSACTTWAIFNDENKIPNLILLNLWMGRVEYPDLRKIAKRMYKDYRDNGQDGFKADGDHKPDYVLIEEQASGYGLIQDFRRAGIAAVKFNPTKKFGDKIARVKLSSFIIETGRVWLPAKGPEYTTLRDYANKFLELCSIFPAAESRDVVDTMTQVVLRLITGGYITHPQDEKMGTGTIRPKEVGYAVEKAK